MTREEVLSIVAKARAAGATPDLSGVRLYDAQLYDADLSGANLRGANLCRANLSGADLNGANLTGANLRGASLYVATLSGMFDGTALDQANLSMAKFTPEEVELSGIRVFRAGNHSCTVTRDYLYLNVPGSNVYKIHYTALPDSDGMVSINYLDSFPPNFAKWWKKYEARVLKQMGELKPR